MLTLKELTMRIALILALSTMAFAQDIKVGQTVSTSDRVLVPMGNGAFQLLAPGVGDVRSITTYESHHDSDVKIVVVERIVMVPAAQPVYQQPTYQGQYGGSNPVIINQNNDDCGGRTYEYQGGNPFNKNSWKRKD